MGATAAVRKYGAWPALALGLTQALEQGERLSLSNALDGLQGHFHVSDTKVGGLAAAVTVVGALGALPFGWLADRRRRTVLLAAAMLVWTVCMGLQAMAPTFLFLSVARIGLGIVEANGPAAVSLIADYYSVAERARAMSRYQIGNAIGGGIGLGLGGVLIGLYGFRASFWMWIPFGLAVAFVLLRLPEPDRNAHDAGLAAELHDAEDSAVHADLDLPAPTRTSTLDPSTATPREIFREVLRIRSMWFAAVSLTISQFFLAALGWWGLEYFKREFGLSEGEAGGYAVVLGIGAFVGLALGGPLADRLLRRGLLNARVLVPALSSILATFTLVPAFLSHDLKVVAACYAVSGVLFTLPVAPAEALMTDVVPGPYRARAASIRSLVRSLASTSPFVIGILSDTLGSLGQALAVTAPLFAVGGVVMLFAMRTYPTDLAFVAAEGARLADPTRRTAVSHSGA